MVKNVNVYSIFSRGLILLLFFIFLNSEFIKSSKAQLSPNVYLNLDVLEVFDPSIGVPKLLMPSPNNNGKIILRPPPGVTPINSIMRRVVLKPPPGMPSKVSIAPKIDVPLPEKPANKPPVKVSSIKNDKENNIEVVTKPSRTISQETKQDNIIIPEAEKNIAEEQKNNASTISEKVISKPPENNDKQISSIPENNSAPNRISVNFPNNSTDLQKEAINNLTPLSEELNKFPSIKIKLLAYASDSDESSSSVRRRSLSRALSVRQFLIDNGIKNTRIEVRALGSNSEKDNSDRVDIVLNRP